MANRFIYTVTVPEDSLQDGSGQSLQRQQLEQLAALKGTGSVTPTGSEPGEFRVEGQFRGTGGSMLARELSELAESDAVGSVEVFAPGQAFGAAGYYSIERIQNGRFRPQREEVADYSVRLAREGTLDSHRRATETDKRTRTHEFGNTEVGYVGIPDEATKRLWVNYEKTDWQSATADTTVAAEFGTVALFDVESAPYDDRPYLVYALPYAASGDVDVAVFDDYGRDEFALSGNFSWQQVFAADHEVEGSLIVENGILRVTLDETAGLSAERWGGSAWSGVALGTSDWGLFDVDLIEAGAAAARLQLEFEDTTDGSLFVLNAILHRGWDDMQLYSPNDLAIPSGLQTRLDPIAADSIIDPQPERTLLKRSGLR